MSLNQPLQLNAGQQEAYNKILAFLFSPDLECALSGPAGTGKTTLMQKIFTDLLPEYRVACELMGEAPTRFTCHFTATTNKAAGVLSAVTGWHVSTINSLLGMRIVNNYETGKKETVGPSPSVDLTNALIFVDEASMLTAQMKKVLCELAEANRAKVIYIGDSSQLNPINESISPVYSLQSPYNHALSEPMRNRTAPALMDLCVQLRETVSTYRFKPIQLALGEVDYLDPRHAESWLSSAYAKGTPDFRILTYTNERAIQYNRLIRNLRGFPDDFFPSEPVVCNNRVTLSRKAFIFPDEELTILAIDPEWHVLETDQGSVRYRYFKVKRRFHPDATLKVAANPAELGAIVKKLHRKKQHVDAFSLSDTFADLRPGSACTVHKSQGSTYDVVLVDLQDFLRAIDKDTIARLLYVAVSRAKSRVLFTGQLPAWVFPAHLPQFYLPKETAHVQSA